MRHVPLLVLGADLDGLGAALALAHQGFPVQVLDRGPDPARVPGVPGPAVLLPEACDELAALGLLDEVLAVAREPARLVHADATTGQVLREVELGPAVRARYGRPLLCLPAAELRRVLARSCAADEMIAVEYDRRPMLVDDVVEAALVSDEEGPVYRAEALIAADGADSRVRALLGGGEVAAVPVAAYTTRRPATDPVPTLRRWSSPVVYATATPGPGDEVDLALVAPADLPPRELRRALRQHVPELRDAVDPLLDGGPVHVYRHHHPLTRWTRHRIAVAGAAAMPLLPHGERVATQAVLDGAALGRAFDRHDGRVVAALEDYERARAPARARGAAGIAELAELFHADGLARRLRDRLWAGVVPDELAEVAGRD